MTNPKTTWLNFFHLYQPPRWEARTIRLVARQCYRPLFRWLKAHPQVRLTFNLTGSLTEQLVALKEREVIGLLKTLLAREQIELTGTAMYHPILPLLPASEIRRQIQLNEEYHRKIFGRLFHPTGFYFPEMSYSLPAAKVVQRLGYTWTILDEIAANGRIGSIDLAKGYTIAGTKLKVVFRHRPISDLFFMAQLKSAKVFERAWRIDPRTKKVLITGCDGENLGHHHPELLRIWSELVNNPQHETLTISQWLGKQTHSKPLALLPSNWASRQSELKQGLPYFLWHNPANSIQRCQWQLTKLVLDIARRPNLPTRWRNEIDKLLASDQYWWASASPWWDTKIVISSSFKMLRLINHFWPARSRQAIQAKNTTQELINLVRQWHESGLASSLRESYLDVEPFTRYFGGRKVS